MTWLLFAALAGAAPAAVAASTPADTSAAARQPLFTRRDLAYAAITTAAVFGASTQDVYISRHALAPRSDTERDFASGIRELGDGAVVIPALAITYGVARLAGQPVVAASVLRIGISTVAAGASAVVLKRAFGRSRPSEAPGDIDELRPFSSHDSMPSGHTTLAFAFARALDIETRARWVPWVVYPAATLVGWSRIHDNDHWTSDVVAGAAVGLWSASKAEIVLRHGAMTHGPIGLSLTTDRPGIALTFGAAR
jgi:membrane-associated phospholipid phosphatase